MLTHPDDFRHDLDLRPIHAEHLSELLKVDSGGFAYAVHIVSQP